MFNWSGEDSIPKLQPEAGGSNNVLLDGAAAPRAAIDAHSLRRCALPVEPSAPDPEVPIAKSPERIERIRGRNHHTIAGAQVPLSDLLKGSRMAGNCFQRLGDAGHTTHILPSPNPGSTYPRRVRLAMVARFLASGAKGSHMTSTRYSSRYRG